MVSVADLDDLDRYFTAMQSGGAKVLSNATQAKKIIERIRTEQEPVPDPLEPEYAGYGDGY